MRAFDEGNLRSAADGQLADDLLTAENTDWHRLGFDSPAFEDDQDANYFEIESWEDALSDLNDFCDDNDPLLVIPSIPGSGKSTFLNQFMSRQQDPLQLHYIKARSIFSLRHLLNAVSENFAQFRNVSVSTDKFIGELRLVTRETGPQLLIIDDAQRLSKETLAGLLQIIAGQDLSDLWLRVILCGEPQLEDRVQNLFDELEFAFSFNAITLDSLDLNQTRAYLKHRLEEAGFEGKFPFSKSMVKHIHTLSSGYPGRVNRVAQQVLVDMAKNQQWTNNASPNVLGVVARHKVKILTLMVLSVVGWGFWYRSQHHTDVVVSHAPSGSVHRNIFATSVMRQKTITIPAIKMAEQKPVSIAISEQKMLQRNDARKTLIQTKPRIQTVVLQAEQKPAQAGFQSKPAVEQKPGAKPKPQSDPRLSVDNDKPRIQPAPATFDFDSSKAGSTASPKQAAIKQAQYTIQLMGVHNEAKLLQYIKEQHLEKQAAYYTTNLQGKPWYVLTYGQFSSSDQAHAAIKKLPRAIQEQKPWVKPISVIHSALRRAGKTA